VGRAGARRVAGRAPHPGPPLGGDAIVGRSRRPPRASARLPHVRLAGGDLAPPAQLPHRADGTGLCPHGARQGTAAPGGGPWARFRRRRWNLVGLAIVLALALTALVADFIASSRPILLRHRGKLYLFANVIEYRDLRDFDSSRLQPGDWALWAPCRHGPYEI